MRSLRAGGLGLALCVLAAPVLTPAGKAKGMTDYQPSDNTAFQAIDAYAAHVPRAAESSYPALAAYLRRPARSDLERIRAFYSYTARHLHMPVGSEIWSSEPSELLGKTRCASCAGYAEVFRSLCLASGIKAVYIRGFSRGGSWQPGNKVDLNVTDHSWNAVLLNGKWYLLDPTWGKFLTPPEEFVYYHLPLSTGRHNIHVFSAEPQWEWQLLDHPLSVSEWERLPRVDTAFFKCGLALDAPKYGVLTCAQDRLIVHLKAFADISLKTSLIHNGITLDSNSYAARDENGYAVHALFPEAGDYTLRVFAKQGDLSGGLDFALDYLIHAGTQKALPPVKTLPALARLPHGNQPDIDFEDFEGDYADRWTVEGAAFGKRPALGAAPHQQSVSGYFGRALANSYLHGDADTGRLTSRTFRIERDFIRFRAGGGSGSGTQMRLVIGGKAVRSQSGFDNEELLPVMWDAREFAGQQAHLEIVDAAQGAWGHISIDQIEFSDSPICSSPAAAVLEPSLQER